MGSGSGRVECGYPVRTHRHGRAPPQTPTASEGPTERLAKPEEPGLLVLSFVSSFKNLKKTK